MPLRRGSLGGVVGAAAAALGASSSNKPTSSSGGTKSQRPTLSDTLGKDSTLATSVSNLSYFHENATVMSGKFQDDDRRLQELEKQLNDEVDEDFFIDTKRFNTLHRVIDVLGLQMIDDATIQSSHNELIRNPAYVQLKMQERVVEGAIEHMAVIHCADLNGSVIQVGKVARQFNDAVNKVRQLRKQVRDIQDTLGAGSATKSKSSANNSGGKGNKDYNNKPRSHNAAAMSLRELWLKKLECEASLALLERLDIIRVAPTTFDRYIAPPRCRIGAAVLTLSQALKTMFADDIAQVQALHKIMEQLMLRKQRAEEILWDTLNDVLFLRTGNGLAVQSKSNINATNDIDGMDGGASGIGGSSSKHGGGGGMSSGQSVGSEASNSKRSGRGGGNSSVVTTASSKVKAERNHYRQNLRSSTPSAGITSALGMVNPFDGQHVRYAVEDDLIFDTTPNNPGSADASDLASVGSCASLFSLEDINTNSTDDKNANNSSNKNEDKQNSGTTSTSFNKMKRMMIPIPVLETELDLEADERRCLEEIALSGLSMQTNKKYHRFASSTAVPGSDGISNGMMRGGKNASAAAALARQRQLPRYADPVLALRILVECLTQLKRLDDVERVLNEGLEREIRLLVQREQARTFCRLERMKHQAGGTGGVSGVSAGVGGITNAMIGSAMAVSKIDSLRDFRRHLTGLLSAFGCVMLRLAHLAEILRFRISGDKELLHTIESPSTILRSVMNSAFDIMQREIKDFLKACLYPSEAPRTNDPIEISMRKGSTAYETGLFSLGIVDSYSSPSHPIDVSMSGSAGGGSIMATSFSVSTATRSNVMEMTTQKFLSLILFQRTKLEPEVRHALAFRRIVARWTSEVDAMKMELAALTGEDTSAPSYRAAGNEEPAITFLDTVIQNDLLPVLQEEAVNGTVTGLERRDAFDPVLDRTLYARPNSNEPQHVDMCRACQVLFDFTGPLFLALHRLPKGGEMYLPIVAVLEHVMLTFISRVKQQVGNICNKKTALNLLMQQQEGGQDGDTLSTIFERRKPFTLLLQCYHDGNSSSLDAATGRGGGSQSGELAKQSGLAPLAPSSTDTPPHQGGSSMSIQSNAPVEDIADGVEGEEMLLDRELQFLQQFLDFVALSQSSRVLVCSDEELTRAASLAHSLLKVSNLLEGRLRLRGRTLTSTRALREAIKTIKANGMKMAKFCRLDMLMQTFLRLSKVCSSSTLVARDAVRIPSSVNDLGEYLTGASDNLREAAGNAVAAYTFSSLEQYIPLCLMQTVRIIAAGNGIINKSPLTMNGIEALDRSGSVLYRDLKGATGFDNSFWDVELAAISFERSASFMAMMELEMEELVAYYTANSDEFSDEDFELMFSMTGPRRRGDAGRFNIARRQLR